MHTRKKNKKINADLKITVDFNVRLPTDDFLYLQVDNQMIKSRGLCPVSIPNSVPGLCWWLWFLSEFSAVTTEPLDELVHQFIHKVSSCLQQPITPPWSSQEHRLWHPAHPGPAGVPDLFIVAR